MTLIRPFWLLFMAPVAVVVGPFLPFWFKVILALTGLGSFVFRVMLRIHNNKELNASTSNTSRF